MLSVSIAKAIPGKPGSGQRQVVQPSCVSLVERVRPHVIYKCCVGTQTSLQPPAFILSLPTKLTNTLAQVQVY
jgi:hypothetical protein